MGEREKEKERDNVAGAGVVTQLVERLLPTPEVRGSNPVIGKLLYETFVYCQLYWKDENKEKEAGNGPFFEKEILYVFTGLCLPKWCFVAVNVRVQNIDSHSYYFSDGL